MPENDLNLFFESIKAEILNSGSTVSGQGKPDEFFYQLVNATLLFRDKMKEQTGYVLTVEDTNFALKALETHIGGQKFPEDLTSRQKALAVILIDCYILYKNNLLY